MQHKFKPHKYKVGPAEKRTRDGITFHSIKESDYYDQLKLLQKAGDIQLFLMQVPFHLPGNVKYICDFEILWTNGLVEFVDVKGYDTPQSKQKRKQVHALYNVKIVLR